MESLTDLLFTTIRSALNHSDNTFKAYTEEVPMISDDTEYILNDNLYEEKKPEEIRLNFVSEDNSVTYEEESVKRENNLIKPVGLALGTYLIANDEDTMYMIDIHAAAERCNYEKILNRMESKKIYTTQMLFPVQIEFNNNEFLTIKENIDIIKDLGFEVEEFGTNTYRVSAHPDWLREGFEEESIKNVFELIGSLKGDFDRLKFNDSIAATMACKASIKANSTLSYSEMEALIDNLFSCKFPYTCPHGRPTIIKYPIHELEKMFKRVNFSKVSNE